MKLDHQFVHVGPQKGRNVDLNLDLNRARSDSLFMFNLNKTKITTSILIRLNHIIYSSCTSMRPKRRSQFQNKTISYNSFMLDPKKAKILT